MQCVESRAIEAARLAPAHRDALAIVAGDKDTVLRDAGFIREEAENLGDIGDVKPVFRLEISGSAETGYAVLPCK